MTIITGSVTTLNGQPAFPLDRCVPLYPISSSLVVGTVPIGLILPGTGAIESHQVTSPVGIEISRQVGLRELRRVRDGAL